MPATTLTNELRLAARFDTFVVPDVEAPDVQLQGPLLSTHRDALHDELGGRDDHLARIARFPSAGPPQTLGMLFWGNRPSASFFRIKRRMVVESKGESIGLYGIGGIGTNTPDSPEP